MCWSTAGVWTLPDIKLRYDLVDDDGEDKH